MTRVHQSARDLLQALRAPHKRRLRIPTRLRIDQRLQRHHQPRIRLRQPRPARPRPTDPPRIQPRSLPHLRDPTHHRVLADPRRPHHRRDPTTPMRTRLRRRPQPPLTLVQLRTQRSIPLDNLRLIDHAPAIRHHNPTSCHKPTNSFVSPKGYRTPRRGGAGCPRNRSRCAQGGRPRPRSSRLRNPAGRRLLVRLCQRGGRNARVGRHVCWRRTFATARFPAECGAGAAPQEKRRR